MSGKYQYAAATLTYENAIEPISENLYQRRVFENRSAAFSENGHDRLAEHLQTLADVYWLKAEVLADFAARLFGLEVDEVIGDASERAKATYEERSRK